MKRARPRKTGWRCSRPSRHFTNTILKAHCSSPRSARRPRPARRCRHGTGTAFGSAREAGRYSHCIRMTLTRCGAYLTLPTSTPKQNACQSYGRCAPGTCRWRSPPCGRRGALRKKPVADLCCGHGSGNGQHRRLSQRFSGRARSRHAFRHGRKRRGSTVPHTVHKQRLLHRPAQAANAHPGGDQRSVL